MYKFGLFLNSKVPCKMMTAYEFARNLKLILTANGYKVVSTTTNESKNYAELSTMNKSPKQIADEMSTEINKHMPSLLRSHNMEWHVQFHVTPESKNVLWSIEVFLHCG